MTLKKLGKQSLGLMVGGATLGMLGSVGSNIPGVGGTLASSATSSLTPGITLAGTGISMGIGMESVKQLTKSVKKIKF